MSEHVEDGQRFRNDQSAEDLEDQLKAARQATMVAGNEDATSETLGQQH